MSSLPARETFSFILESLKPFSALRKRQNRSSKRLTLPLLTEIGVLTRSFRVRILTLTFGFRLPFSPALPTELLNDSGSRKF